MRKWLFLCLLFLLLMLLLLPAQAQQSNLFQATTIASTLTPIGSPTVTSIPLIIDAPTAIPVLSKDYEDEINSIAWSPDSRLLAVEYAWIDNLKAGSDYRVTTNTDVWLLEEKQLQISYSTARRSGGLPIFFTRDGSVIVYPTDVGEVIGHDAFNGQRIYEIYIDDDGPYAPVFTPLSHGGDNALLISMAGTKAFPLDLRDGAKLFAGDLGMAIDNFWSSDGARLYTFTDQYGMSVFDGRTGLQMYQLPGIGWDSWALLSPDNRLLFTMEGENIALRESHTGSLLHEFPSAAHPITWSPDSQMWLSRGEDDQVVLWKLDGNSYLLSVRSLFPEFSPGGQYIIADYRGEGRSVVEVSTLEELNSLPDGAIIRGWSHDDHYAVVQLGKTLVLYTTSDWLPIQILTFDLIGMYRFQWSPNGMLFALAENSQDETYSQLRIFSLTGELNRDVVPTPTSSPNSQP